MGLQRTATRSPATWRTTSQVKRWSTVGFRTLLVPVVAGGFVHAVIRYLQYRNEEINPFLWPMILFGMLSFFVALQCAVPTQGEEPAQAKVAYRAWWHPLLLVAYVALLPYTGFAFSTPILLAALLRYHGSSNPRREYLLAGLVTVFFLLMFQTIFYIPLPSGVWLFRVVNELAYSIFR